MPPFDLRFIPITDPRYAEELELRFRVLREPLGHPRSAVAFPFEAQSLHLIALAGERLVGCVLFHPEGPRSGRLFQMAVAPDTQGQGIGRLLVKELEREVAARGFGEITLHARQGAVGFYERLGYAIYGDPFVEVDIPHRHMKRGVL